MTSARKVIIFDIETAPLPDAELAQFIPQFDPPSNYKDPEKIQQWLDAKKIGWAGEAALSPLTGRVDAIGIVTSGGKPVAQLVEPGQEAAVIAGFWLLFQSADSYTFFTGFNIKRFDLPFLVRRRLEAGRCSARWCPGRPVLERPVCGFDGTVAAWEQSGIHRSGQAGQIHGTARQDRERG